MFSRNTPLGRGVNWGGGVGRIMFAKRVLTGFLALLLVMVVIMPVNADQLSDQKQLLNKLNQQEAQQRAKLNQASRTEKTILGQMQNIEQDAEQTQHAINVLADKIAYLQDRKSVV